MGLRTGTTAAPALGGGLMVLAAAVLWSLLGVIVKTSDVSAVWMMVIRSAAGGIVLSPFLLRVGRIRPLATLMMAGVSMGAFIFTFILTTRLGGPAMAVAMQYAAPMYVIAYHAVRVRRISGGRLAVLVLMLAGVALNVASALGGASPAALPAGLALGLFFIAYSWALKNIREGSTLAVVSATNFISAGFFSLSLPFHHTPFPTSAEALLPLIFAGIFVSGASYALYGAGLKRVSLEAALIIALAEPILNPLWVFLGTGERPPALSAAGLLLILAAALLDAASRLTQRRRDGLGIANNKPL